jgi:hypothetical protein
MQTVGIQGFRQGDAGGTYGLPNRCRLRSHCDIGIVSRASSLAQSLSIAEGQPPSLGVIRLKCNEQLLAQGAS